MPVAFDTAVYAFLGGLLPALVWLWFFLREDSRCPEPPKFIVLTFIAGMVAVFFVLPAERFIEAHFSGNILITLWAFTEEIAKYGAAALIVLWRREAIDEPLDGFVYMMTTALGFAAFENTLFLLGPILDGELARSLLTGNLRFLGATLLHTLASGVVGLSIGFAYFYRERIRRVFVAIGLFLATALHTLFNLFIMNSNGEQTLIAFACVWIGVIALFFIVERIKILRDPLRRALISCRVE